MCKRNLLFVLTLLALGCTDARAASDSAGATTGEAARPPNTAAESKLKVLNPMREKEPMSGEMKRDGMIKEDVHKQAMKKDAMMREAMKKEEMKK